MKLPLKFDEDVRVVDEDFFKGGDKEYIKDADGITVAGYAGCGTHELAVTQEFMTYLKNVHKVVEAAQYARDHNHDDHSKLVVDLALDDLST